MLKNLKMSAKLVAVLIAPVLVLLLLAYTGIQERQTNADAAATISRLTELASAGSAVAHEVQVEAILAATLQASGSDAEILEKYEAQQKTTDAQAKKFQDAGENVGISEATPEGAALLQKFRDADKRLVGLDTLRRAVADGSYSNSSDPRGQYGSTVGTLVAVSREASNNTQDPTLSNELRDLSLLGSYKSTHGEIAALLAGVTQAGTMTVEDRSELFAGEGVDDLLARLDRSERLFEEFGLPENKTARRTAVGKAEAEITRNVTEMLAKAPGDPLGVTNEEWLELATENLEGFLGVEKSIVDRTIQQASDLRSDAEGERNLFMLGTLVAVAFALGIAFLVSRATARPLRQLTDAAYELSNEKLPSLVDQLRNPQADSDGQVKLQLDAIQIDSRDEVGLLAEAFNAIQRVTIDVAEEQAGLLRKGIGDIFINLARRNQNILDRQIEFIDMLEAKEEDPDQLDNLFKLDHLATRMRRNAESLLVLAGAEPPRRRGRPVDLADVIRVAIGEVEDFARIGLVALDDVSVEGNVAVDLAHLLSEFMENATHFSPPDTQVEVMGRWTRDAEGSPGYTITVADQGIGMSAEQMAEANHLLAHPPLVGLALSRSLGFIVIGRLAERLGIRVSLESAPTGGVVALVALPASMIKTEGEIEIPSAPELAESGGADTLNIEPYEPVAYQETPYEEVPAALDEPATLERSYEEPSFETPAGLPARGASAEFEPPPALQDEDFADLPSDEDFDKGLADLLDSEPPIALTEPEEEPASEPEPYMAEEPVDEPPVEDAPVTFDEPEPVPAEELAIERPISDEDSEVLSGLPTRGVAQEPEVEPEPAASESAGSVTTSAGLVKRTPKERKAGAGTQSLVGGALPTAGGGSRSTTATQRSPEEVRKMLSRYRAGVKKEAAPAETKGDES